MTVHLSVRLPWHDSGWNGCVCQNPKRNVYCGGLFSVNAESIRQSKDDICTDDNAGKPVSSLNKLPPCAQHVNTFGDQVFTFEHQPRDFLKAKASYAEKFTASCFATWPYDSMYDPEAGRREADDAERRLRELFNDLEKDRSLIFFYLNYSNPLCPERRKYVLVGISRYRDKGELMRWSGMPQERIEKYGDLVWSRRILHDGSDECFIIPYHYYLRQGLDVSEILLTVEGPLARRFKYVSRPLSDGDAKEMVSGMLRVAKQIKEDGVVQDNWDLRLEWLDKLLDECWHQRGLFPGLAGVLGFLRFDHATDFAHSVLANIDNPREYVFNIFEGQQEPEPEYLPAFRQASKRWNARPQVQKELLKEHLCLFELTAEQIEHVLGGDREHYGITSSLEEILDNPYIITEEYNSGKADDIIALHQIDQGMMPSTKLEAPWRIDPNDPRRIRAALTEILEQAAELGHSFLPTNEAIRLLDNRGEEWHNLLVDVYDLKAEIEHYGKRVALEEDSELSRLALKETREHELKIRETVEELLARAKRENSGLDWDTIVRTGLDVEPDDDAVREQVASLEPAYCNSFFVLTGAAGTGKTTMLNALIQGIKQKESESAFLLLAPTGKAALRLSQKTHVKAYTIDAILWQYGWGNEVTESLITEGGKLISNYKNIIIDECSMVDVEKLGILFRAIPWSNIRRLVMVGDPNQLPPIGVGKPFADIIDYIVENETFKNTLGQLRVNCRIHQQMGSSAMLQLASGYTRFGEDLGSEEILSGICQGKDTGDICVEFWKDEHDLPVVLDKALKDSLSQYAVGVDIKPLYETFNSVLGLTNDNTEKLDTIQVLGPVRGEYFGIDSTNFRLQKLLRRYYLQRWNYHLSNFARYDKVIHIKNKTIYPKWYEARDIETKDWIKAYVPNGALGSINIFFNDRLETPRVSSRLVFDMVPGVELFLGKDALEERLELGYAITVHKAQGSDFDTIILMIPSRDRNALSFLSPELLYTALTRARTRLYLLLQETCQPLLDATFRGNSVLLKINSAIFTPTLAISDIEEYRPGNLIHKTLRKELVRSKSELAISICLCKHDLPYYYEKPLVAPDKTLVRPDFTIPWKGEDYYWEHLGMLDLPDYRVRWQRKKEWYEKHGFTARLITSDEVGGFDSTQIEEKITHYFT